MGKEGAEKVQAAAMGHNKPKLQAHIDKVQNIQRKIDTLKGEMAQAFHAVEDDGFDRKEFKAVVKNLTKPTPVEFKRGVNNLLNTLGQRSLFDIEPVPEKKEKAKDEKAA